MIDELHSNNTTFKNKVDINYTVLPDWEQLLNSMPCINLDQLQAYSLMRRYDSKYLVPEKALIKIVQRITDSYFVLEVENIRLSPYCTTYYDSSDFMFYRQHHSSIRKRVKVRTRTYLSTDKSYLEIKRKGLSNRMVKERIAIEPCDLYGSECVDRFFDEHCPIPQEMLEAKLHNQFMRITLANRFLIERVTIDLGLTFLNRNKKIVLPGVAVLEVKQEKLHTKTALVTALHDAHLNPQNFSKYCIGISLLEPQVKHNRFKKNLIQLKKLLPERKIFYGIA